MRLSSDSFDDGATIPAVNAFGTYNPESHVELSDNKNPQLTWGDAPEGTQSFAVLCWDVDAPTSAEKVNKEGMTVPKELPRADFYHWVLVDVPASVTSIPAGEHASGVTAKGKSGPVGPGGSRHGLNNYTQWFEGDADMAGEYFGYDGPCPPWNDERVHNYNFTVYALDVERCSVEGKFDGPAVLEAMKGHILASAKLSGSYHIYPDAR